MIISKFELLYDKVITWVNTTMNVPRKLQLKIVDVGTELKPSTVISWNVDGYTHDIHLWLQTFVLNSKPDVIFLSETKKPASYLEPLFAQFTDYHVIINVHHPSQWHGVAMFVRKDHVHVRVPIQMNIAPRADSKAPEADVGRVIAIQLDHQVYIIGSYTPNSGMGGKYLKYRTEVWDPGFMRVLDNLRANGPTMWVGDINVAPDVIDTSNPKVMATWSGCSPEERRNFSTLISTGEWIDIWRHQNPTGRLYTWCGSPPRPNYGMRLDNIVISKTFMDKVMNTFAISGCPVSADHIPIGVYINLKEVK